MQLKGNYAQFYAFVYPFLMFLILGSMVLINVVFLEATSIKIWINDSLLLGVAITLFFLGEIQISNSLKTYA